MSASLPSLPPGSPGLERRPDRTGLLVLDKSVAMTSHDVVDRVRRRLRVRSAGHLGTLDPGASGLLLVAVGAATRCAPVWQGGEKTYQGTVRFGVVTASQDLDGEVLERHPVDLDEPRVRAAAASFVGEIEQIPPMVSALKVQGQRLYRLARRGITVERAPRSTRIVSWEWLGFDFPSAEFRVRCSSGTYVRTLVHDLGQKLGTGAALAALRRLRSEPFGLERAIGMSDLDCLSPDDVWARAGLGMEEALSGWPSLRLDSRGVAAIGHGAPAVIAEQGAPASACGDGSALPIAKGPRSVVFLGPDGEVLALGELERGPEPGAWLARPHVVFPWALRSGRSE